MQHVVRQNNNMWNEIHGCISKNDLEQLMTLLSKHTINNLNSLNLSWGGDTVLHSAAKSNNVEMIEFILQRISPSAKQRMLRIKNRQQQLPTDLLTIWAPSIHSLFPLKFRQVVKAVLMLGAKRQDGTPYYPQTHFHKLPKDLLFLILQYAAF
jgi:ankyrin repeat protein